MTLFKYCIARFPNAKYTTHLLHTDSLKVCEMLIIMKYVINLVTHAMQTRVPRVRLRGCTLDTIWTRPSKNSSDSLLNAKNIMYRLFARRRHRCVQCASCPSSFRIEKIKTIFKRALIM